MLKRPNTLEIIAVQDNTILLSHQSQPNKENFYSLFGGRGEEGEEPLESAKRELLEEAGLESDNWELFKVYEPAHKIDWHVYTYIAKNCKKVGEQHLDPGEKIEIVECTFEKFLEIVQSKNYWGNELALDIFRMKQQGELDAFRTKLFQK